MEWLTPFNALIAGAIAIPLLLLMYFLKLKRHEQMVSSTLLWQRAIQDLQVNAPFQKIRRNLLLLIQLLMVILLLLALAGPTASLTSGPGRRYILLIDRSASMGATDIAAKSRLEEAKKQAITFVQSLRDQAAFSLHDTSDQAMVIAFNQHGKVQCNFTSDKRQIISAIKSIEPGGSSSSLGEAMMITRAFAQSLGVDDNNRDPQNLVHLILFSDGQIRDLDQIDVGANELTFHSLGQSGKNTAVTSLKASRSYENPDEVNVFATVSNYDTQTATCDVQFSVNNNVHAVKSVTIPARIVDKSSAEIQPGKAAVNFSLSLAETGVVEVRQLQNDSLKVDDAAWTILPPPQRLTVLLVTVGNVILESALRACPLAELKTCTPVQFNNMDHSRLTIEKTYDVIVLDKFIPDQLPRSRYLIFGSVPNGIDVSVSAIVKNQIVVDWQASHPVLKYVNLSNIVAAQSNKLSLPRDAEVLAEFNETPALALLRRKGSVFLLAGFDILQSNWPFEPGFVLFCYNATNFLGTQTGIGPQSDLLAGQPIHLEGLSPGTVVKIDGPHFSDRTIKANPSGALHFPDTDQVGIYTLKIPDETPKVFAVNLLDDKESNIEPRKEIALLGRQIKAADKSMTRSNLPLWPYFVVVALILTCIEWMIYNSKTRL